MRPPGWFVVLRDLAPRRVCHVKELMALRVVVNMSDLPQLERSATHKLLVLAGGIYFLRWPLIVRECTGYVGKSRVLVYESLNIVYLRQTQQP